MHDPDPYQAIHDLIKRINKASAEMRDAAQRTRQTINDSRGALQWSPASAGVRPSTQSVTVKHSSDG